MEIRGQNLFLPPNFAFLSRLPARFQILVVGRGAEKNGVPVFEIEIQGQRLALPSRVPLIPGKRYELEKISETEFRIVAEKSEPEREAAKGISGSKPDEAGFSSVAELFAGDSRFSAADLVILRLMEEAGKGLQVLGGKFAFDFTGEFELRGLFHPHTDGTYTLFLSGARADTTLAAAMSKELASLRITGVRILAQEVFDHLASGAIDLRL